MKAIEQLRELLSFADTVEDTDELPWEKPFRDMLARYENGKVDGFSAKQRAYVADVYERVTGEVTYQNLWSAGKIPKGTLATPIPDVLRKPLPMKPPGRR